jgi:hypothetical protein
MRRSSFPQSHKAVGGQCDRSCVDLFDASDYDFLLSRPARKTIALVLMIGIAFVPPVKRWYIGQIEHHAQHIMRDFMSTFITDTSESIADAPSHKQAQR